MKAKKPLFELIAVIILVGIITSLLCGCSIVEQEYANYMFEKGRPKEGTALPDFSGNITDVRMTVKERDYGPYYDHPMYENLTMIQIYYGYLSDGEWHDMPCENYNLIGVFEKTTKRDGWQQHKAISLK